MRTESPSCAVSAGVTRSEPMTGRVVSATATRASPLPRPPPADAVARTRSVPVPAARGAVKERVAVNVPANCTGSDSDEASTPVVEIFTQSTVALPSGVTSMVARTLKPGRMDCWSVVTVTVTGFGAVPSPQWISARTEAAATILRHGTGITKISIDENRDASGLCRSRLSWRSAELWVYGYRSRHPQVIGAPILERPRRVERPADVARRPVPNVRRHTRCRGERNVVYVHPRPRPRHRRMQRYRDVGWREAVVGDGDRGDELCRSRERYLRRPGQPRRRGRRRLRAGPGPERALCARGAARAGRVLRRRDRPATGRNRPVDRHTLFRIVVRVPRGHGVCHLRRGRRRAAVTRRLDDVRGGAGRRLERDGHGRTDQPRDRRGGRLRTCGGSV